MFKKLLLKYILIMLFLISLNAHADKIRDLITIQGARDTQLIGYGLVAGLNGTGDDTKNIPYTIHTLQNMLAQLGIGFSIEKNMKLKNIAAVMVTAKYSSFIHEGQKIDVIISSIGNATSLKGGTLLMTPLRSTDNKIYAVAQGSIIIDETYHSQKKFKKFTNNQFNSGKIIEGAIIEREINNSFGKKNTVILQLNNEDFTAVQKISDLINVKYPYSAIALNSKTIQLNVPKNSIIQVRMLSEIQNIDVNLPDQDAKIVINTKTGDIAMNHEVKINSCAVAHGNISMIIHKPNNTSHYFQNSILNIKASRSTEKRSILDDNYNTQNEIKYIDKVVHLNSIVHALNSLGIKPIELISILQAMHNVGCLRAKLEII
ncbi:MAG: flagellar basal body P-ring protein FlgI [Buchnera aphidicola (Floraphis choui)]